MTLKLDDASFDRLHAWRREHFPPARNLLPAHLTLFHTLSALQLARYDAAWPELRTDGRVPLRFAAPRYLGGGVAIDVESAELDALRARTARLFGAELTRQDHQRFRAHVTIQNKVEAAQAQNLYRRLCANFVPWSGWGTSILIWRYLGGPWAPQAEYLFPAPAG